LYCYQALQAVADRTYEEPPIVSADPDCTTPGDRPYVEVLG